MKLLNVAPVKVGDVVTGLWTDYKPLKVIAVRNAYPGEIVGHDWLLTLEDGCNLWWVDHIYWEVQKSEAHKCGSCESR